MLQTDGCVAGEEEMDECETDETDKTDETDGSGWSDDRDGGDWCCEYTWTAIEEL